MLEFSAVRARRISDEIGEQIRRKLATNELGPGDKLPSERELAIQLGVSRNAVREALRSLEMAGVITLHKGAKGGAFISEGDPAILANGLRDLLQLRGVTIEQLTEARIWISEIVTRTACARATEADLEEMAANVAAAERAYLAGDFDQKLAHLIEFHAILARAAKNPVLILVTESLLDLMHNFARRVGAEDNDIALKSRRRLMKHLRARKAEAAVAEMTSHLEALKVRYINYLEGRSKSAGSRVPASSRMAGKRRRATVS